VNAAQRVVMNRARALLICTRPADYPTWRVREAAEHLLAQPNASEEDKQVATDALKKVGAAPAADAHPEAAAEPARRSHRATGKR
jgi:hypothetical protein